MYGKVKLTKKQIKEDKFTTFMLTAKQQVTDSWQYYVIGIVVIILVISAIAFYQDMQETQKLEAANIYSQGIVEYRQTNYQNALLSLQKVIDEYSGTESAQLATFMLGKANLKLRSYSESIRAFELYISKYSDNKLKTASSYAGIGVSYENQEKYAEAASAFVSACEVDSNGPLIGDYHFSAMRNLLATGDIASAETHYNYINENLKGTNLASRATMIFAEKSKQ